ncbi:hypothetical protein VTN49DRAFT_3914 [Thermomyces lanuginosus]|uniref:uncharacterized protein n=1 Tax=Thermomyces lanuginosus TaxID=5541 RepID=UPI003743CFF4
MDAPVQPCKHPSGSRSLIQRKNSTSRRSTSPVERTGWGGRSRREALFVVDCPLDLDGVRESENRQGRRRSRRWLEVEHHRQRRLSSIRIEARAARE